MEFSTGTILFAFLLTLFAGLSTGIGSALAFLTKQPSQRFLSAALGFSAGVMIYVSRLKYAKARGRWRPSMVSVRYLLTTILYRDCSDRSH